MPDHNQVEFGPAIVHPGSGFSSLTMEERRSDLEFAMERGDLAVVQYYIEREGVTACSSLLPDGRLDAWLTEAKNYEDMHGEESFLVVTHRFNVDILPYIRKQISAGFKQPRDCPAPFWSMERGWTHN